MWKNLQTADYIGLAHYRRYFDDTVTKDSIERWLGTDGYDAIGIEPISGLQSNFMSLCFWITPENVYILFDTMLRLHPEYHDAINSYFFDSNVWRHCNMSIMQRQRFDDYCSWLFPILEAFSGTVIRSGYNRINRFVGYAAEALLGLYFTYNNMKVKDVGLFLSETNSVMRSNHFYENLGFAVSRGLRSLADYLLGREKRSHAIEINDAVIAGLRAQGIVLDALERSNNGF